MGTYRSWAWLCLAIFILSSLMSVYEQFMLAPQTAAYSGPDAYYLSFIKNNLQYMPFLLAAIFFAIIDIGDRLPPSQEEPRAKSWWQFWK
jgi:hypothetical protein